VDDVSPPFRPADSRPALLLSVHERCDGLVSRRLHLCLEGRLSLRRLGFRTREVPNRPSTKHGGSRKIPPEVHCRRTLYAPRSRLEFTHVCVGLDHIFLRSWGDVRGRPEGGRRRHRVWPFRGRTDGICQERPVPWTRPDGDM
jgi:hypothetical protein